MHASSVLSHTWFGGSWGPPDWGSSGTAVGSELRAKAGATGISATR